MKRELAWKQAYDLKIAENEQLRRDGNFIIDKVMAESKAKDAEIERLKAENDQFRRTLEIIAEKSTDQLQRMQAIGALANIGRALEFQMKHPLSKKAYREALAEFGLTQGYAGWLFNGKSKTSGRRWAVQGAPFSTALIIALMREYKIPPEEVERIGAPWRKKGR